MVHGIVIATTLMLIGDNGRAIKCQPRRTDIGCPHTHKLSDRVRRSMVAGEKRTCPKLHVADFAVEAVIYSDWVGIFA